MAQCGDFRVRICMKITCCVLRFRNSWQKARSPSTPHNTYRCWKNCLSGQHCDERRNMAPLLPAPVMGRTDFATKYAGKAMKTFLCDTNGVTLVDTAARGNTAQPRMKNWRSWGQEIKKRGQVHFPGSCLVAAWRCATTLYQLCNLEVIPFEFSRVG
jgi:hypothetical protein